MTAIGFLDLPGRYHRLLVAIAAVRENESHVFVVDCAWFPNVELIDSVDNEFDIRPSSFANFTRSPIFVSRVWVCSRVRLLISVQILMAMRFCFIYLYKTKPGGHGVLKQRATPGSVSPSMLVAFCL